MVRLCFENQLKRACIYHKIEIQKTILCIFLFFVYFCRKTNLHIFLMRTPLFALLQKAFQIANQSLRKNQLPVSKRIKQEREYSYYTRRDFLSQSLKAGAFLGTSALFPNNIFATPPQGRIVIVGAGLAGLTAAYYLKKSGITNFTIYEAAPKIGGRIQTLKNEIGKNLFTEAGGEFIDSNHKDIARLLRELDLETIDTFRDPLPLKMQTFFFEGKHRSMEEIVTAFQPILAKIMTDISFLDAQRRNADSKRIDNTPLDKYIDALGASAWMTSLLKTAYTAEFGVDASEQSALNFLDTLSLNLKTELQLYGSNKDRRYKIRGGSQTLISMLAKGMDTLIYPEMKLTEINSTSSGQFNLTFNEREIIQADFVIMTLPFSALRTVKMNENAVSPLKKQCIDELGYGNHSKLMMGFSYRMWRARGYMGYMLGEDTQASWDNGLFQNQLQNKATEGGYTICLGGSAADRLQVDEEVSATQFFLPKLDLAFPKLSESFNKKAKIVNWGENPFVKGSVACFKVGQRTHFMGVAQAAEGNLLFAGEHCSTGFMGTMNGAAETGRQAAQKIINILKPKQ